MKDNSYDSWVWRKKTHTGVLLNFTAVAPTKWKFALIICLLNRVWDICSDNWHFNAEVEKLKNMFIKNGYPTKFFSSALNRFQASKQTSKTSDEKTSDDTNYIKIPFLGPASVKFAKSINMLFEQYYGTKLTPVYTSFKVKTYFGLKSRTPTFLCSNVVYRYKCLCDTNKSYIGVTARPLCIRIDEHLNSTRRSGNPENDSAIIKHLDTCQKCFQETRTNQLEHFEILRHCTSQYTAKIHEALLIKRHNPTLNVHQFNKGASFTLKVFN